MPVRLVGTLDTKGVEFHQYAGGMVLTDAEQAAR
jgi:hypothetical protein